MKFIIWKKALTLVELVISITISSIVLLIIMTFIADSIETVVESNEKTKVFDNIFEFKDKFWRFSRWGYFNNSILLDNTAGTWNDVILLKNIDSSEWIIFWVVDVATMKLETNAGYKYYGKKVLGYRKLTASEITGIESVPISVYDLIFFPDKLFQNLKVKDFQVDFYNSQTILDINIELFLYYNKEKDGELLSNAWTNEFLNINFNF